jgi:ribonuclease HI
LWIFTDGGSRGNGKENCSASYAFYITDGCKIALGYGIVEEKEIPGEVFRASNNRGELTAMMKGLEFLSNNLDHFAFDKITLVSDSEYSINCLDKWAKAWFANPAKHKLSEKKNLDIIVPAKEALDQIRTLTTLNFRHVRSHLDEPTDNETDEWFIWKCNDIVDVLCNKALGRC